MPTTRIAMLLIPQMTQLDFTGPYEMFARAPDTVVELVWKDRCPVRSEFGLTILPTTTLADATQPDVIFVPGGRGVNPLLTDDEVVSWVRSAAARAKFVTSVCTGALILGAAGLLRGKRATTHWSALDMLSRFGAIPERSRTVIDGKVITGGGVTAGIDFGLRLIAELRGETVAQTIQLATEYDPQPPFNAGHPDRAPAGVTAALREKMAPRQEERWEQVERAATALQCPNPGSG